MKLPAWFGRPKVDKPMSAADLAQKLQDAEGALAAAQARVEQARDSFATERTEATLTALSEAKGNAEVVAEMLEILRKDHANAVERERQEHLAGVRSQRDQARAARAEATAREASVTTAAALALVEGWCRKHPERVEAIANVDELDRQVRALSAELGEEEPAFINPGRHMEIALADAIDALAPGLRPGEQALLHRLLNAVEPGYDRIRAMQKSAETSARMAEERRLESLSNPAPKTEVIYLDSDRQRRGPPPIAQQIGDLLKKGAG
jgi:hypothetical protein